MGGGAGAHTERFEIVAPRLLDARVRVDRRVARSAGERAVLAVRDVPPRPALAVLLREPKVDEEDARPILADTYSHALLLHIV